MTHEVTAPRWSVVDCVFLDMDGTLLDKQFDDYFWEEYLPREYARRYGMGEEEARGELLARYEEVRHSLAWADLDYWSDRLGMDLAALKEQIRHLVRVHPHVFEFLRSCRRAGKTAYLITNAHARTLEIKLSRAAIGPYFHRIITAGELGRAKEEEEFWPRLGGVIGCEPSRCLLADDTERVLETAAACGIAHLLHVARPSSSAPARYSSRFPSIRTFRDLVPWPDEEPPP